MNYKKLAQETIKAINDSNDCIWYLSTTTFYGEIRLYLLHNEERFAKHYDFENWKELLAYLKGFQHGANSLKPF